MAQGVEFTDYPTADELWRCRTWTWRDWAAELRVGEHTIRRHLNALGWQRWRGPAADWKRAPCERCGEPFTVQEGQSMRRCPDCQCVLDFDAPPVQPAPPPQWAVDLAWGRERIAARVAAREKAQAARKAARLAAEAERPKGEHRYTAGEWLEAMDTMQMPADWREVLEPAA